MRPHSAEVSPHVPHSPHPLQPPAGSLQDSCTPALCLSPGRGSVKSPPKKQARRSRSNRRGSPSPEEWEDQDEEVDEEEEVDDDEGASESDGDASPRRNEGAGRRFRMDEAGDEVAADMKDGIMDEMFDKEMIQSGYYDRNELETACVAMEDGDSQEATLEHSPETRAALGHRSSPAVEASCTAPGDPAGALLCG